MTSTNIDNDAAADEKCSSNKGSGDMSGLSDVSGGKSVFAATVSFAVQRVFQCVEKGTFAAGGA